MDGRRMFDEIERNNLDGVKTLVQDGCDLNQRDERLGFGLGGVGNTPLTYACEKGFLDIVKYLIEEANADIWKTTNNAQSSLCTAVIFGHFDVVKYLCEKEPTLINPSMNAPLQVASFMGRYEIAEYLLNHGADIEAKNPECGKTPLIFAATGWMPRLRVLQLLVEKGHADINAVDDEGKSALAYAIETDDQEVEDYLVFKGATFHSDVEPEDDSPRIDRIEH